MANLLFFGLHRANRCTTGGSGGAGDHLERATVGAQQLAFRGQLGQVAADGYFAGAEARRKLRDGDPVVVLECVQDKFLAFFFEQRPGFYGYQCRYSACAASKSSAMRTAISGD